MIYFDKFNSKSDVGYRFSLEEWEGVKLKKKIFANYVKWDTDRPALGLGELLHPNVYRSGRAFSGGEKPRYNLCVYAR